MDQSSRLQVQCPHCQARFMAGAQMLGKRVRCRQCSAAFEVAAAPVAQNDDPLAHASSIVSQEVSSSTGTSHEHAEADPFDGLFEGESTDAAEYTPQPIRAAAGAPVVGFLDSGLPHVVLGAAALWFVLQSLAMDNAGYGWLSWVRLLGYAAGYVILVFPITLFAVKAVTNKQRGYLPWSYRYKTAALFALPFVLAFALGVAAESMVLFFVGALIGLAPALVMWWLLFRIRPEAGAFAQVGAAFLFGMLLIAIGAFGTNYLALAGATSAGTNDRFALSPVFPGLPWDTTPQVASARGDKEPAPAATAPALVTPVAPEQPAVQLPADAPVASDPEETPAPETTEVAVDPIPEMPADVELPEVSESATIEVPTVTEVAADGLAARLHDLPVPAGFESVIGTTGPWRLIVSGNDQDQVFSLWNTIDWSAGPQVKLRRDAQVKANAAISPDGQWMVRLASWPQLSVQVWSFSQNKVARSVPLDGANGTPDVIGFIDDRRVLLSWAQGNERGLELVEVDRDRPIAAKPLAFALPGVEEVHHNLALRGDRAYMTGLFEGQVCLLVYDIGRARLERRVPIAQIDPRWGAKPAGMVLSPDQSLLAAFFEHQGNVMILQWNLALGQAPQPILPPHLYPAGQLASRPEAFSGDRILWLKQGWLLWGTDVIDPQNGQVKGQLGVPGVVAQQAAGDDALELVTVGTGGRRQLVRAELKAAE